MKTNLLRAIKEMKEQITSGWSKHERTHFGDFLEEEIKQYYPNLYLVLHGDFEDELKEKAECDICQFKDQPISECKLFCYEKISVRELLEE